MTIDHEHVFAYFEGRISPAAPANEIRIHVHGGDFDLKGGKTLLGFVVQPLEGSSLDPLAPQVARIGGGPIAPEVKNDDLDSGGALAIVELDRGRFTITVGAEQGSTGAYRLNVFLVGDANGDREVNYLDVVRLGQLALPEVPWLPGPLGHGFQFDDSPGRNPFNPLDVAGDGSVTNADGVLLAHMLRLSNGGGPIGQLPATLPFGYPDVNGDGALSNLDVFTVASHLRQIRRGYAVEADANLDGRITHADFLWTLKNLGDGTDVEPLAIDLQFDPLPAESDGKNYTDEAQIALLGTTLPGKPVTLDSDADGLFDNGSATSDANGAFSFGAALEPGLNKLRAQARDRFGQKRLAVAEVHYLPPEMDRALFPNPGVQQMPSVAVNPLDPEHVVVAYMDYSLPMGDADLPGEGYAGIAVAVSHNGGLTWTRSQVPVPEPFNQGAANPIARFDDAGNVYVTYMAATFLGPIPELTHPDFFNPDTGQSDRIFGFQSHNGIFVARSDNGGLNWNDPVAVDSELFQGAEIPFRVFPDLAVDRFERLPDGRPNPNYGNLYSSFTRVYPVGQFPGHPDIVGGTDVYVAVSRDQGESWEIQLQEENGVLVTVIADPENTVGAPGLGIPDSSQIAIGPEGDIYITQTGGGDFVIHHSVDGGQSFSSPDRANGLGVAFGAGFTTSAGVSIPNNNFRVRPMLRQIAADPTQPGRLYAAETVTNIDAVGGVVDSADVVFARSSDYGQTWETEFLIGGLMGSLLNDDNDGQKATGSSGDVVASQVLARMAVDELGNIGVIWYDTRRDPADHLLDVYGVLSTDGGASFSRNFLVTDVSFDADEGSFTNAIGGEEFAIGDFIGIAMANNSSYSAWTDARDGNQEIYFARNAVDPAPAALNDRFEPNDTPDLGSTPTMLGRVVQRLIPKLTAAPGDEDWFLLEASRLRCGQSQSFLD